MRSGATQFTFAGVNSEEYDLLNFSTSSGGLNTDSFVGSRVIIEEKIQGRDAPYFYNVERNPMSFKVKFGFAGNREIEESELDDITDWFIQDTYQPLVFSDNPDKIYYVIFDGIPNFVHNGAKSGYFTLNARSLYPYPVINDTQTGIHTIVTSDQINVKNSGKVTVVPNINITIASSGNNVINIYNLSNGTELEVEGAFDDVIEIDGFNRIATNVTDDIQIRLNERWLKLDKGDNDLVITGDCDIDFNFKSGIYS